jgi:tetratricopeptide (TPR) repeat protein
MDELEPSDEVYQALISRFESNLRAIVMAAHAQGVEVYIIPTPPHLAYPPFYQPGPGRPWANDPDLSTSEREEQAELRERARSALTAADWTGALVLAEESANIDPFNASVFHVLGRALHELGRTDESIEVLLRAHALDVSRKRSQPAFNDVATRVCQELGCKTDSAHDELLSLAQAEGLGVYDRLLGDHEHLNPEGNAWVAELFTGLITGD